MRNDSRESGLTLVELMVAFGLLSIILAAAASSFITFSRATVDNERRVQATALMNRLHEELQSIPWFDAVVYEGELGPLQDADTGIVDELGGRELVTMEGPSLTGCPSEDPECNRRERVPRAYFTDTIDDRDYEVYQAVTWADGSQQIKRFTTVVRWQVLQTTYEERFESERAATAAEAGDPTLPRVIQFQVGPSPMTLSPADADLPQRNTGDIDVVVRFSQGVETAQLRFYTVTGATPVDGTVELEEQAKLLTPKVWDSTTTLPIEFAATLPAGQYRFSDGSRTFRITGWRSGEPYSGTASMMFLGGGLTPTGDPDGSGEVAPPPPPPDEDLPPITSVPVKVAKPTLNYAVVCVDANHRFQRTVTVTALVDGMTADDYDVAVTYTANKLTRTRAMVPVTPTSISQMNAGFQISFPAGVDHEFRPQGNGSNAKDTTTFTVTATRRSDNGAAGPVASDTFTADWHKCS